MTTLTLCHRVMQNPGTILSIKKMKALEKKIFTELSLEKKCSFTDTLQRKNSIFVLMRNLREIKSALILQLLLAFIVTNAAPAQSSSEMRDIFAQAESYYLYEEFELANQLYLLLETPDNLNIKYKIGTCYLNIPGEKEKSIPYLEEAVKSASYDSKTESFKEMRAPLDAYFSLAKAYMINDDLEKGMNTLLTFQKLATETKSKGGMQNLQFIDQQIQACKTAINLKENPVLFTNRTLGPDFSMGSINDNPAVSFDGNSIVYTERRGIVNVIFYSRKERGKWQPPIEITSELNAGEDCSTCALNSDGTVLFLYKTDNYDGAIYSSTFNEGYWTPIKKLNRNINTKFYESHASVSSDGKRLYFASNRDGGQGNLDIYVSEIDQTGDWSPAVNLGPVVNTPYNEDTPFITNDGNFLYFSSEGHTSMGGYDNFKSHYTGSAWETPENIGYPVNSSDDDKFLQPYDNGKSAFYSMTTNYKKTEISFLVFGETEKSHTFEINGIYSLSDTIVPFDKNYSIHLLNSSSGDTIDVGYPNKLTGQYNFIVNPGEYRIIYSSPWYLSQTVDTVILNDHPTLSVRIDVALEPDPNKEMPEPAEPEYDKINLTSIPLVEKIDSSFIVMNMNVSDLSDRNVADSDILYFTVQVIALHNPVDVSYFKHIDNLKVMYNEADKFYRYTTGQFSTREEAYSWRLQLIRRGYPEEIFIKKVSK
ncbi:MAG TPA: hypothetical protein DCP74_04045 [Bacteroidales bacterium]|nr:hypothetical protein [Bacteroidales bacterium]